MQRSRFTDRRFLYPAAAGGIAAGIVSTAVQVGLWLIFTDAFPAILWRDARLTAALVLGPAALAPGAYGTPAVFALATLIHFAISIVYGVVMAVPTRQLRGARLTAAGALLGLALYLVNLHGFTLLFPWFAPARGAITLVAHLAFGIAAVSAWRWPVVRQIFASRAAGDDPSGRRAAGLRAFPKEPER